MCAVGRMDRLLRIALLTQSTSCDSSGLSLRRNAASSHAISILSASSHVSTALAVLLIPVPSTTQFQLMSGHRELANMFCCCRHRDELTVYEGEKLMAVGQKEHNHYTISWMTVYAICCHCLQC
jgi:hypothetical protein